MIKSHIQIPKFIMDNFSHKTNYGRMVYCFDIKKNEVNEVKINQLGTEYGYYSEETEKFLSKEIEAEIGPIVKQLKLFSTGKLAEIKIIDRDQDRIKNFLKYSFIRSNQVLKDTNDRSIYSSILGNYTTNDILENVDFKENKFIFDDYYVDIIENRSDVEFITLRNCMYSAMVKGKLTKYIFPISPQIAFCLIHNSEKHSLIVDNVKKYLCITDNDQAKSFNYRALFDEIQLNNDFVLGHRRSEIEDVQKYYQNIKCNFI